jgi:sentrin-specific protease 1
MDKIFIPINISQTHWALAVILVQDKEILYFDSMKRKGKGTKYNKALLQWLVDEARTKKNINLNTSEWKLKDMDCPQQHNGYDCGVFLIMAANFISDNLRVVEDNYGQAHMPFFRLKIASDILRGSYDYPID